MDTFIVYERPKLNSPYLVLGISGWVDGGEASTGSVKYLINKLGAKRFGEISAREFHVFQVPGVTSTRPYITIEDGIVKKHRLPKNEFFYWVNERSDHDLVLFLGTEPAMRWEEYCDALLGVAQEFKVERIYYLGGVMDSSTPYTKEPNVSCIVSNPDLKEEMKRYAVLFANYEGPGSIGTTLLDVSAKRGMEYVSLIGRSLWYPEFNIGISQNPKVMGAILKRLRRLLGIDLDLSTVEKASQELEDKLNFMASQIPRFGDYVKKLEEDFEEIKYQEPIEIKGDEAVKAAEEFLKRKPEGNS